MEKNHVFCECALSNKTRFLKNIALTDCHFVHIATKIH
jgi:hypothetical protein